MSKLKCFYQFDISLLSITYKQIRQKIVRFHLKDTQNVKGKDHNGFVRN